MKTTSFLISLILVLTCTVHNAQSFKNASGYIDFIGDEQDDITKEMWNYTKAIAHSKSDKNIDNRRKRLLKTIESAITKIEKADGYGDTDYKSKVLRHMNFNRDLLNQDYAKIIDMKAVAEQSYDDMEAYILAQEMAQQKMEESQQEFETDLYNYANANNIEILENDSDLGKKMATSNDVFEHYSDLYLIYFKVYINEIYLMEALEKNDVGAIQQNANALNAAAKKGLEVLDAQEPYKKDDSVIKATRAAFEFFIEESGDKIPKITDFLVMNEDFEKIRNTLDQMPERDRTKTQIDEFNKKVKQINKGINDYNTINNELNNDRQTVINNLNTANANFLSRHIPND